MRGLFVLTRDDPNDDPLARQLEEERFEVARLQILATEPGRDGDRFLKWLDEPPDAAIVWTSRRAAQALAAMALPRFRETLARLPLYAVGEESAAPIRDAGLAVEFVPDAPSAKRLAALILDRPGGRRPAGFAFLHGDRALPDLPESLRAAGIEVDRFELYRIRFLTPDLGALEAALSGGREILICYFSPSTIEGLERILSAELLPKLRRDAYALPWGGTTRQALGARGYGRVLEIDRPSGRIDPSALEALQSFKRTRA